MRVAAPRVDGWLYELRRRAHLAYVEGAEETWQRLKGRPMTADELGRVIDRVPWVARTAYPGSRRLPVPTLVQGPSDSIRMPRPALCTRSPRASMTPCGSSSTSTAYCPGSRTQATAMSTSTCQVFRSCEPETDCRMRVTRPLEMGTSTPLSRRARTRPHPGQGHGLVRPPSPTSCALNRQRCERAAPSQ
jgi:hypothetical protein